MMDSFAQGMITRQSRVLIKPNFLSPANPDKAVLTHPLVTKAAAEYVLLKGAKVQISDSPAIGSFEKIMNEGGYSKVFEGLDVEFKAFSESVKSDIGEPFGVIEIARDALEADVVLNLAKLKTHTQMLLTLGVKNLFGCIIGIRKPEWHLRTGIDREMFGRLLVQIYKKIAPAVTIVDGILAMEGQGPGNSGIPRDLGIIIGSNDAVAADKTICNLLGLEPARLPTDRAAEKLGLHSLEIHVSGDFTAIYDFKFPELGTLSFGPKPLHSLMRKHLVQRPVVNKKDCMLCGECVEYCPAGALSINNKKIMFDYDVCIRCCCCIEVCPHAALRTTRPLAGKLLHRIF